MAEQTFIFNKTFFYVILHCNTLSEFSVNIKVNYILYVFKKPQAEIGFLNRFISITTILWIVMHVGRWLKCVVKLSLVTKMVRAVCLV